MKHKIILISVLILAVLGLSTCDSVLASEAALLHRRCR
jgi:hypothetical protein